ncbi:AP2-like ethylene-responsive transcription factor TOE2 isoform X2 [Eutrema salsugineum]|uniref:AP2-like ethylene-responsive transcription factor TOE2 isoform X2 n=1 Tax=Eutrema salsugineum TaxID=72664 RepID=UPI000CECFDF1|nr:AP2-like ethylene-responsive transcription factor TOE2 isoform X2 [Eutrema salsugineum]
MMDLNLDVDSADSTQKGQDSAAVRGFSGAILNHMDEMVTSNASVVNAEASSYRDGEEDANKMFLMCPPSNQLSRLRKHLSWVNLCPSVHKGHI